MSHKVSHLIGIFLSLLILNPLHAVRLRQIFPKKRNTQTLETSTIHLTGKKCDIISGRFSIATGQILPISANNGAALFLIYEDKGHELILFQSKPIPDSAIFKLYYFSSGSEMKPIVILAEYGNEYIWGYQTFLFAENRLKYLGSMQLVAKAEKDTEEASAIRLLQINMLPQGLHFKFTGHLTLFPGTEREVKRVNAEYIYDEGVLKLK